MANMYINAMTALWNSVGTTYSAIKMNVTDSGSHADSKLIDIQVASVERFTVKKNGDIMTTGLASIAGSITAGGGFLPLAADGGAVGSSALPVSDVFIASGGVINWAAADITITHSSNLLTFAGATSGYVFDTDVRITTPGVTANSVIIKSVMDAADTAANAIAVQRANHTGTQLASTISDFAATVRATVLTGLSLVTSTAVTAADTILVAIGKLQAQITSNIAELALKAPLISPSLTGTPISTTAAPGTSTTQIATTAFVQTEAVTKAGPLNDLTGTNFIRQTATPTETAGASYTPDVDGGVANIRQITSPSGAWTLNSPGVDPQSFTLIIRVQHPAAVSTCTLAGFHKVSGDAIPTAANRSWLAYITRLGGVSTVTVEVLP